MTVLKDKKLIALELSADGTEYIAQAHYLTNQFGRLRDICIGPEKEIFLATNGASWSNTNPNTHSIIRLKVTTSVSLNEDIESKMKIYPNPTDDFLNVCITAHNLNSSAEVTDFSGRLIKSFKMESLNSSIDLSGLAKGTYYLKLTSEEGIKAVATFVKK